MIYIVPTPIGNIEDITVRALKTLSNSEIIACEDTRVTGNLLKKYSITPKKLVSLHEHSEKEIVQKLIDYSMTGLRISIVSDAGLPGISDPGIDIVKACIDQECQFTILPGAVAFPLAFVASGFESPLHFWGFPPHKQGRKNFVKKALSDKYGCAMFYESPHRLMNLLELIQELINNQVNVFIGRELSKIHEEYLRGTVLEIIKVFEKKQIKGEIVVAVDLNCQTALNP